MESVWVLFLINIKKFIKNIPLNLQVNQSRRKLNTKSTKYTSSVESPKNTAMYITHSDCCQTNSQSNEFPFFFQLAEPLG